MRTLDPGARQGAFAAEMDAGRFAQALTLYARLRPRESQTEVTLAAVQDLPALLGPAMNGLNASYAYAATGEPARARVLLAETRGRVDRAFALSGGSPDIVAMRARITTVLKGPLTAAADQWGTMIGARAAIAEGHPAHALRALVGAPVPVNAAGLDLLTALRPALSPSQSVLAPDPAALAAKLDERRRAEKLDIALLRRAMPAPETSGSLAGYGKASSGFLSGLLPVVFSADGFTSHVDTTSGVTTVEFTGQATSAPVVDELTLLRAADLARAAGRPAFIIVSRRDYARTMNTYQRYGHALVASRPAGYKTVLGVRFVDPAALPADLAGEGDRALDAERVRAVLGPVYLKR